MGKGKAFINYRHDDDPGHTGRLYDHLERAFGSERLLMDLKIPPGDNFFRAVKKQVAQCDVLLPVIGKNWLDASDATGARRLDNPYDLVRIEIEWGLKRKKLPVIPVLVDGARMPRPDELPREIRPLAWRKAIELTHKSFHTDVQGLIEALHEIFKEANAAQLDLTERAPRKAAGAFFEGGPTQMIPLFCDC